MGKNKEAGIGHNSGDKPKTDTATGGLINSAIQRIERLEDERDGIKEDIKDVYAEFKGKGLEPKILRRIIRLRKVNAEKAREEQELLELYASAAGIQLPLGL